MNTGIEIGKDSEGVGTCASCHGKTDAEIRFSRDGKTTTVRVCELCQKILAEKLK